MAIKSFYTEDGGRPVAVVQINPDNIPSDDEKAGLSGSTGFPLSATNKVFTRQESDRHSWQMGVRQGVNYVKATPGAPAGVPGANEYCLNTNDNLLYAESGGSWAAPSPVSEGDRFLFHVNGQDNTGNSGVYTADKKIYERRDGAWIEHIPEDMQVIFLKKNGGAIDWGPYPLLYRYDATLVDWRALDLIWHNFQQGLQGGQNIVTPEYYHLTLNQHGAAASAQSPAAGNPFMTKYDRELVPVPFSFCADGPDFPAGLPASFSGDLPEQAFIVGDVVQPKDGSMVAIMAEVDQIPVGSCTIIPTINGAPVADPALNLSFPGIPSPQEVYANATPDLVGLSFTAGQNIGIRVTTDPSWGPVGIKLQVWLLVVYTRAGWGSGGGGE